MKQANNNDVDLLLRSLARRRGVNESPLPGGSASGSENPALFAHLDADELNSYAEGVLPAPARARYTEHLADCESCRRIVVGLTQAAVATRQPEVVDERSGSGFWRKFAAFFSPPVLRYAVPALALTAVIAISMIALRQQRRSEFVAQNQPTNSPATSSEPRQTELRSTTEPPATQERGIESKANADSTNQKKDLQAEKSALEPPSPATSGYVTKESPTKDSAKSGQAGGVVALNPSFAPEPPPPPASRPAASEANEITTIPKEQPAEREDLARQREQDKNQPRDASASQKLSKTGASTLNARRNAEFGVESTAETRSGGKDKKESRDEVETRKVSGRHFRHQGNAWIDTAYDSSRATINVARGSEQFRSLVADEPGIRAIAEQLGGEVIVVWKGKAYRIH